MTRHCGGVRALVVAIVIATATVGCGRDTDTPDVGTKAAALCTTLQRWIDGIERTSTALSDRTTAEPDPAVRKQHFEAWADEVIAQTEEMRDDVEELDLPAPLAGVDDGIGILHATRDEIATFPERDRETLGYRVARVFLAMENVFAKVRTSVERLGGAAHDDDLTKALVEEPACRDYNDPLT
jgi:hypothetical protein